MAITQAEKQARRKDMMLTDPIHKVIPKMAVPTIVSFIISAIYSLTDTYFVSSLGTNATAAVSVNSSLDQIIMMAGSMLAIGATSYVSRLLGAKRDQEASNTLSTAFFIAALFGAVVMTLGIAFMEPLVRLLGATDTCLQYSIDYATYILVVAPFMAANFVMNQCLRGEGSATFSMIGMAIGNILNCILDPIFIFSLDMGVAGASMATAISKLVSFCILITPYITKRTLLRLSIRNFRPTREMMTQIVSVGSSSLLRNSLGIIAAIVLNNIAGSISDSVLAGIGVSNKVMQFPFFIVLGFSSGFQPVAGFNWGAKRFDRVRESFRFASRVGLIGAIVMAGAMAAFAVPLITLFAEADPEMQRLGALCIRMQCIAMPIHAWVAIVNGFCSGLGYGKYAVVLATSRQGSCFLPIVYPMAMLGGIGIVSVQAVADCLTLIPAIPILRKMMGHVDRAEAEFAKAQLKEAVQE